MNRKEWWRGKRESSKGCKGNFRRGKCGKYAFSWKRSKGIEPFKGFCYTYYYYIILLLLFFIKDKPVFILFIKTDRGCSSTCNGSPTEADYTKIWFDRCKCFFHILATFFFIEMNLYSYIENKKCKRFFFSQSWVKRRQMMCGLSR